MFSLCFSLLLTQIPEVKIPEIYRLPTKNLLIILSPCVPPHYHPKHQEKNPDIYVELQDSQLYGLFVSLLTTKQKIKSKNSRNVCRTMKQIH